MREIKFRAWDQDNNKFFEPTYEAYKGKLEDLLIHLKGDLCIRDTENMTHESLFPNRFVLQQFTGLKDKNGVEIYEGDVVRVRWRKDSAVGRVRWFAYGFYVMGMKRHSPISLADMSVKTEVIGNIYDNPELLEVES